jgi:hypothetical protein
MNRIKRVWECNHEGKKYKGHGRVELIEMGYYSDISPMCLCTGEPIAMKLIESTIYNPDSKLH